MSGKIFRNPILALLQNDFPLFTKLQSLFVTELNLFMEKYISSDLANLQARFIMMSQNRQEEKNRDRARRD